MKTIYDKYDNNRKIARVTMHLTYSSALLLLFSIYSKSYTFVYVFGPLTLISLFLFIYNSKRKRLLEDTFKSKCPKCGKQVWNAKGEKKMLMNVEVDDLTFDTTLSDDKQVLKIDKYICDDCKFCYSIIDIYKYNKGELKLYSRKPNIDEDYNANY